MNTKINILKNNCNGASLLEVMIAMVILTVGFLGVMALSVALTNDNASAGRINTATVMAQSQVSQLNCLGVSGIKSSFTVPGTITYQVTPLKSNPDNRNPIIACINKSLAVNGPPPINMGVTLPYTVTVVFSINPNVTYTTVINAQVSVSWQDIIQHSIVMNDIIAQ